MSWNKKNEDVDELDILLNLDKAQVLQEAKIFNVSPIRPKQCRFILAKVLFLLYTGETLSSMDATELFFSITKLFQSPDISLRQMVYLAIKELSSTAEHVIFITNSLSKDMQPQAEAMCRPNAIRALCKITDSSTLPGIERFFKAAIVDKSDTSISSAALISSYHMFSQNKEVIRRWSNEVQEALISKGSGFSSMVSSFMRSSSAPQPIASTMIQYHALGLIAVIRQHDRMATTKLVQTFVGGGGMTAETLKDPFAHCLLIRLAAKTMEQSGTFIPAIYDKLCNWLRNRNDAVSLEAAKAICAMPNLTVEQVYPAVRALQQLLTSSRATLRFAAIRTINRVAAIHAAAMSSWKLNLDELISDSNRSVATFAITALLKIGTESTVDALIKQVSILMNEISDEFRVIVVDAIKSLGLKFPAKHNVLLGFLSGILRDEGGFEFKRAVVDAVIELIQSVPSSKEAALSHLCEFIEDCEFSKLAVRVLHFLGQEGPKASNPTVYIRFIYNRVVLETAVVRAAAVSALAKFGIEVQDPKVKHSVKVLLNRCLNDPDDEVRDRAVWSLRVMEDEEIGQKYVQSQELFHLGTLEQQLIHYCQEADTATSQPFDITTVPTCHRGEESNYQSSQKSALPIVDPILKPKVSGSTQAPGTSTSGGATTLSSQLLDLIQTNTSRLHTELPETKEFGQLLKSNPILTPIELTEAETEYVVHCIKHIFKEHVVFEFTINNTINDMVLEDLTVEMELESGSSLDLITGEELGDLELLGSLPASAAKYDSPVTSYIIRALPLDTYPVATFTNVLKFTVKDCDPNTGEVDEEGFEDEYSVESVKIGLSDYMIPAVLASPSEGGFTSVWASMSEDQGFHQAVDTFILSEVDTLKETVEYLVNLFGMQPVEGYQVQPDATTHTLSLTGKYGFQQSKTAVKVRMTCAQKQVTIEVTAKAEQQSLAEAIVLSVG